MACMTIDTKDLIELKNRPLMALVKIKTQHTAHVLVGEASETNLLH